MSLILTQNLRICEIILTVLGNLEHFRLSFYYSALLQSYLLFKSYVSATCFSDYVVVPRKAVKCNTN